MKPCFPPPTSPLTTLTNRNSLHLAGRYDCEKYLHKHRTFVILLVNNWASYWVSTTVSQSLPANRHPLRQAFYLRVDVRHDFTAQIQQACSRASQCLTNMSHSTIMCSRGASKCCWVFCFVLQPVVFTWHPNLSSRSYNSPIFSTVLKL